MNYPTAEELRAHGIPEEDWEVIVADDPITGDIRLNRYLHHAKYNFNWDLIHAARRADSYACGSKYTHTIGLPPEEVEPPEDLTGLFPDPQEFIEGVKLERKINAIRVDDLEAFNDDGRARAIRLGFPPDSWVVKKEDIDYRSWREKVAALGPED